MAKSTPSTILLKGNDVIYGEEVADAAITPGHLCERTATGVKVHATAGGDATRLFARENALVGNGITTAYASADNVYLMDVPPGSVVYGLVAAAASAIVKNDPLESAGDGTVRKHTALSINEAGSATKSVYTKNIVGFAEEAVDNHLGASATRIRIRVA